MLVSSPPCFDSTRLRLHQHSTHRSFKASESIDITERNGKLLLLRPRGVGQAGLRGHGAERALPAVGELGTQCCPSACMVRVLWSQERKDRPRESSSRFNVAMRDVSIQSWYL